MSLLDDIAQEVSQLSDDEIAAAAAKITERKAKERARMTPDRAQKMKDREKRRRLFNKQVLELAKSKGLVPAAPATETTTA